MKVGALTGTESQLERKSKFYCSSMGNVFDNNKLYFKIASREDF